jgi:Cytochrome c
MRFDWLWSGKALVFGACLVVCFTAQDPAEAGDAKAGRAKAESVCGVCHGVDGLAKIPEAPNLAGQSESYLTEQITAFKAGDRKNEMMSVVVQDPRTPISKIWPLIIRGSRFRSKRPLNSSPERPIRRFSFRGRPSILSRLLRPWHAASAKIAFTV